MLTNRKFKPAPYSILFTLLRVRPEESRDNNLL